MRRKWLACAGIFALFVVAALAMLVSHWPFRREPILKSLGQISSCTVEMKSFRQTYFPHPGFIAEQVSFRTTGTEADPSAPPLVTVSKVAVEGSYFSLLTLQKRISRMRVEGLHVKLPAIHQVVQSKNEKTAPASGEAAKIVFAEITADGATLETFPKDDKPPLHFAFRRLTVTNVGQGLTQSFRVTLDIPKPAGEVRASGRFGPLVSGRAGQAPVSGEFTFEHGSLGVFKGIAGNIFSRGKFSGPLKHIGVEGAADTPDFSVTRSHHTERITARYRAFVDGTNGDTTLREVDAHIPKSELDANGEVAGSPSHPGKTATIKLSMREGRLQDLLRIFVKSDPPPMSGVITLRATATLPPEKRKFMEKLRLQGDFGIGGGHFSKEKTQTAINKLSERARGDKEDDDDPERVISGLKGHVALRNGIATLTGLTFSVPGAVANLQGTFSLLDERVNLTGTLRMDATVSQATKGIKSFLLKAVDPFFKKKGAGAVVPVKITGTYSHATVALNLGGKKAGS